MSSFNLPFQPYFLGMTPIVCNPCLKGIGCALAVRLQSAMIIGSKLAYREYLKSWHWKDLRQRVLARDNHRCVQCGATRELQAHHTFYRQDWYDAKITDLITLCRPCHRQTHGMKPKRLKPVKQRQPRQIKPRKVKGRDTSISPYIFYYSYWTEARKRKYPRVFDRLLAENKLTEDLPESSHT